MYMYRMQLHPLTCIDSCHRYDRMSRFGSILVMIVSAVVIRMHDNAARIFHRSLLILYTFFAGVFGMEDGGGRLSTKHIKCVHCGVQKRGGLVGRKVNQKMIDARLFQSREQWLCANHYNDALKALKHAKPVCLVCFCTLPLFRCRNFHCVIGNAMHL